MLKNNTVLVTGGTGSFGQKCVETLLKKYQPKKIIVFSRDELKQFQMAQKFPKTRFPIRYFIGDVRDKERLRWAFQEVDYVIHAAAMKQVPASEYNPTESIKTNITGSENIVAMAAECGVKKVIALSTDKAVNPINLYGATKLCAEKLFIAANAFVGLKRCKFSLVRYGNVVGSRGSVIPLFLKQKKEKKDVSITHPEMTRFWITLEHGVEFVLQSLMQMKGGETFIPKISSMKITDLAAFLAPECKVRYVGIRQGEKLHETLISQDEARNTIESETSYIIRPDSSFFSPDIDETGFEQVSEDFEYVSDKNDTWISKEQVHEMVSGMSGMDSEK